MTEEVQGCRPWQLNNSEIYDFHGGDEFDGLNARVDWLVEADVLKKRAVSIFNSNFSTEDGGSTLLQNVGFY